MGDDDKKGAWITEDAFLVLGMGFFVICLFLEYTPGYFALLSGLLSLLGVFSVFLMIVGTYKYLTKQETFTVAAGFVLAFLITVFFSPVYVIRPIAAILSILSGLF